MVGVYTFFCNSGIRKSAWSTQKTFFSKRKLVSDIIHFGSKLSICFRGKNLKFGLFSEFVSISQSEKLYFLPFFFFKSIETGELKMNLISF